MNADLLGKLFSFSLVNADGFIELSARKEYGLARNWLSELLAWKRAILLK